MPTLDRNAKSDVRQRRALQKLIAQGSVDGGSSVTDPYTVPIVPTAGSVRVYRNGLKLREGLANDYTIVGASVVFTADAFPEAGSVVEIEYEHGTTVETPAGAIDGTNDTFTLSATPVGGTLRVYRNGQKLREGATNDYEAAGDTITFTADAVPAAGSSIEAIYEAA